MNKVTEVRPGVYELHTADPDESDNRLQVFLGGNGDYYLGSLREGRFSFSTVQVTGCGGGQKNQRVMLAVAELYRAMKETATHD